MTRRLFFLFPDEVRAATAVSELEAVGVSRRHIHALTGKGQIPDRLPVANARQQHDSVWRLEQVLWGANLTVFALALIGLIVSLFFGFSLWSILAMAIMLITFGGGAIFALLVPDTHLDEFRGALAHSDILVMVDVPKRRVAEIEELVQRRHPDAAVGGVGWTIEALGV